VIIHLQSRVESVDVEASEITLSDGRSVKGDLIIGADGTHVCPPSVLISSHCQQL
jgi:2-polyprenyl-6-methoxyphenol hydroxylase-like FAD-dependent oxidoreductase